MIKLTYGQTHRNQMAAHGFYHEKRDLQTSHVKSRQAYSNQGDALTRCKKRNPQTVREFSDQSSRDCIVNHEALHTAMWSALGLGT